MDLKSRSSVSSVTNILVSSSGLLANLSVASEFRCGERMLFVDSLKQWFSTRCGFACPGDTYHNCGVGEWCSWHVVEAGGAKKNVLKYTRLPFTTRIIQPKLSIALRLINLHLKHREIKIEMPNSALRRKVCDVGV